MKVRLVFQNEITDWTFVESLKITSKLKFFQTLDFLNEQALWRQFVSFENHWKVSVTWVYYDSKYCDGTLKPLPASLWMVKILTSKNFLLTQDSWVQSQKFEKFMKSNKKWRYLRDYLINFLFLPSLFKLMQSSADMKLRPTEMLWEVISWHISSRRSMYRYFVAKIHFIAFAKSIKQPNWLHPNWD